MSYKKFQENEEKRILSTVMESSLIIPDIQQDPIFSGGNVILDAMNSVTLMLLNVFFNFNYNTKNL